eukprot:GCRY01004826.1.p1 GENE.GCRY01004826.1~~GCRY01004826.1.p1  ORF type:complete len:501 (+),score=57.32 GCRY01004826.1:1592-3094(+)
MPEYVATPPVPLEGQHAHSFNQQSVNIEMNASGQNNPFNSAEHSQQQVQMQPQGEQDSQMTESRNTAAVYPDDASMKLQANQSRIQGQSAELPGSSSTYPTLQDNGNSLVMPGNMFSPSTIYNHYPNLKTDLSPNSMVPQYSLPDFSQLTSGSPGQVGQWPFLLPATNAEDGSSSNQKGLPREVEEYGSTRDDTNAALQAQAHLITLADGQPALAIPKGMSMEGVQIIHTPSGRYLVCSQAQAQAQTQAQVEAQQQQSHSSSGQPTPTTTPPPFPSAMSSAGVTSSPPFMVSLPKTQMGLPTNSTTQNPSASHSSSSSAATSNPQSTTHLQRIPSPSNTTSPSLSLGHDMPGFSALGVQQPSLSQPHTHSSTHTPTHLSGQVYPAQTSSPSYLSSPTVGPTTEKPSSSSKAGSFASPQPPRSSSSTSLASSASEHTAAALAAHGNNTHSSSSGMLGSQAADATTHASSSGPPKDQATVANDTPKDHGNGPRRAAKRVRSS